MILIAEHGQHFRRDGDRWRCLEHPVLEMRAGGVYVIAGRTFTDLADALAELERSKPPE